ncbi:hypothetical protein HK405_005076, partial [Cladochytrium tenue]
MAQNVTQLLPITDDDSGTATCMYRAAFALKVVFLQSDQGDTGFFVLYVQDAITYGLTTQACSPYFGSQGSRLGIQPSSPRPPLNP